MITLSKNSQDLENTINFMSNQTYYLTSRYILIINFIEAKI